MHVGDRIRQRRKALGLSAEQVAEKMGVSPATVYRYESAEILNMKIDKIEPIAEALQTTPAWLMGWEDMGKNELVDEIETTLASLPADAQREVLRYIQMKKEIEDEKKK